MSLKNGTESVANSIEQKSNKLEADIDRLNGRIRIFSNWAWRFVVLGFLILFLGIWAYIGKYKELDFGLDLIGDFTAGTVSSVWSLAGLLFIYIAFLGQKQQL